MKKWVVVAVIVGTVLGAAAHNLWSFNHLMRCLLGTAAPKAWWE